MIIRNYKIYGITINKNFMFKFLKLIMKICLTSYFYSSNL